MGLYAGQTTQASYATAIGVNAGKSSQGDSAVALGTTAGNDTQGANSTAVGRSAAQTRQGANSVAVGRECGRNDQGVAAVALGLQSGYSNQSNNCVAIGNTAGYSDQGDQAVAIGLYAGQVSQGDNSIAIGFRSGQTSQHANSLIISSKAVAMNSTEIGGVRIETTTAWLRSAGANWSSSGNSGTVSDIRLKENVEPITDALAKVNTLNGITFSYIENGSVSAGLIAQEVQAVLPEAVFETDSEGHLAVGYGNMVGLLVESIKELTARIEALENK